jgi:hypothetical protein
MLTVANFVVIQQIRGAHIDLQFQELEEDNGIAHSLSADTMAPQVEMMVYSFWE